MTDKWKYKSVSLRNSTYSNLNDLSETLVPGLKLSQSKTIEKLINSEETSCPSKNGKGGHPVILSRKDCEGILSSDPSTPLRDIIEPIKIEVNDEYLHLNIDFPEDLEKLREITREHNL